MKMGSMEKLPDGWIRKESRSRPNNFYYFHTKTGKSQWISPADNTNEKSKDTKNAHNVRTNEKTITKNDVKTGTRGDVKTTSKSDEKAKSSEKSVRFKVNDKSKELKKRKSKTPAQDRIQKLVDKNSSAVIESVKEVVKSANLPKTRKPTNNAPAVKKSLFVPKRTDHKVDSKKSTTNGIENVKAAANVDDEIPVLFPPKTLAQDRLRSLQNTLCVNESLSSEHDATRVFGDSFGFEGAKPATFAAESMDEEMDWEPCEDSNYTFQQLESMAVDVLTESAYIIPDTNVFLDSLASIKTVIEKECKYNILIPFVVLQELDQLKRRIDGNDSVSGKASRAIRYIYDELKSKNPRLHGQKAMEDKSHVIDVTSPDDKILNCCLQLKNQSMDIILATNDKNLSNKALLNGIEAITSRECLERF